MQYALLIYADPDALPEVGPEPGAAHEEWVSYFQAVQEAGAFISAEGLHGVDTATSVRHADGEVLLTDGPFAETKEHLLGFYLIEAADLDAAIDWAARMPVARRGTVEVRPLLGSSAASVKIGRAWPRARE